MDVLSEILDGMRSEGMLTRRFTFSAPWGFAKDAVDGAYFRIAKDNSFWISVNDGTPVLVEPGDLVLLPRGDEHRMTSAINVRWTHFDQVLRDLNIVSDYARPLSCTAGGGGVATEIYAGILLFRERRRNSLLAVLPEMIHIKAAEINNPSWFISTLERFIDESMSCPIGWQFTAARMADLLLLHVLRIYLQTNTEGQLGWLRGLHDPKIAHSLILMHSDPVRPWSVSTLASEVMMSRSRFDAKFRDLVGESPISFLTARRMLVASEYLVSGRYRTADIADKVGYASEKSFARAFCRWAGVPPKTYLRQQQKGKVTAGTSATLNN
jgi:AraC-like DNA-binding protein